MHWIVGLFWGTPFLFKLWQNVFKCLLVNLIFWKTLYSCAFWYRDCFQVQFQKVHSPKQSHDSMPFFNFGIANDIEVCTLTIINKMIGCSCLFLSSTIVRLILFHYTCYLFVCFLWFDVTILTVYGQDGSSSLVLHVGAIPWVLCSQPFQFCW